MFSVLDGPQSFVHPKHPKMVLDYDNIMAEGGEGGAWNIMRQYVLFHQGEKQSSKRRRSSKVFLGKIMKYLKNSEVPENLSRELGNPQTPIE